ncbi:lanthionine synthetase LanC family protein [Chryseobacterium joostei]|uniref:lanthionine synthetase LanC family protein n=1 Tax=Chryseobacterium joostei TaxID=112234 RepID=UPI0023F159BC|nr:lanthionine synthetase LanC family protein [Chryseobacterium joostei]
MRTKIEKELNKILSMDLEPVGSDGLFTGKLSYVYSLIHLDKTGKYAEKANEILGSVISNVLEANSSLLLKESIYGGLSGLGWLLREMDQLNVLSDHNNIDLSGLNEKFFEDAIQYTENNNFDYLYGGIGILYYLNLCGEKEYVTAIIDKILEKENQNKRSPFFNDAGLLQGTHFGYAHGLPSLVKIFSEINDERMNALINDSLNYQENIIRNNHTIIENTRYVLPRTVYREEEELFLNWQPSLTWSNSDLNFSTTLYSLPEIYKTENMIESANIIIEESVKRTELKQTVHNEDYRLFFGSAGVAQLYKALYDQNIMPETTSNAYEQWIGKTCDFLDKSNGEKDYSYINGKIGAILSVKEYLGDNVGDWDKLLLI